MKINNEKKCNPLKGLTELIGEYKISFGTTTELTKTDRDYQKWFIKSWVESKVKTYNNKSKKEIKQDTSLTQQKWSLLW